MTILGLDPGYVETGYGIIRTQDQKGDASNKVIHIASGSYKLHKTKKRLWTLHQRIFELCCVHNVSHVAIENVFFSKNVQTTLKLGYIAGISISVAERCNLPYRLIPPKELKKVVLGSGNSSKEDMQRFIVKLLNIDQDNIHATDALAASLALKYLSQA